MHALVEQLRKPSLAGRGILIVDDEPANVALLEQVLAQGGYHNFRSTTDSRQVLPLFQEFQPDLVLLDLLMPHLDGFAVLKQLGGRIGPETYLPVLVLTADVTSEAKEGALSLGARDFLTKPFDIAEVLLRIRNLLETRELHLMLLEQNSTLEQRVRERTRDLEEAQYEILDRLSLASEYRDDRTGEHTRRVGLLSERLALQMGFTAEEARTMGRAATLHDVGKIGIPDLLLLKHTGLTAEEFDVMKNHTTTGAKILSGSRFRLLQIAETIALTHHERWDGSGYSGLAGDSIPIEGRIVAVADSFDAMVNDRPYQQALAVGDALGEIQRGSGTQFDPLVVAAFLGLERHDLISVAVGVQGVRTQPCANRTVPS